MPLLTPRKKVIRLHSELTDLGLLNDDHSEYILASGARAFTGDQSFGGNNINNVTTVSLESLFRGVGAIDVNLGFSPGDNFTIGSKLMFKHDSGLLGLNNPSPVALFDLVSVSAGTGLIKMKGVAGQAGNYFRVENSTGGLLFNIDSSGGLFAASKFLFSQTDGNEKIDSVIDNELDFFATNSLNHRIGGVIQVQIVDGSLKPFITNDIDHGTNSLRYKNAYYEGLIHRSVESGIVADPTPAQGDVPLTKEINEVATVASSGDSVTLPPAVIGLVIVIIHNGGSNMDVFPASGDAINGGGVNNPETQSSGSRATYYAVDTTNWYKMEV